MEIINLEGTEDTPKIILDKTNKIFEISGRSLPEDSAEFYQPVLEWLAEYAKDPLPETTFDFKLEYFNTASSKFTGETPPLVLTYLIIIVPHQPGKCMCFTIFPVYRD